LGDFNPRRENGADGRGEEGGRWKMGGEKRERREKATEKTGIGRDEREIQERGEREGR
jgi:hypothetical protein